MSDHTQTTAKSPAEPRLCKMGCGFFGNGATGDCCSKCWGEMQKKKGGTSAVAPVLVAKPMEPVIEEAPQPMEVEETKERATPNDTPADTPKKRKKKTSYKSMMAGIVQTTSKDIETEKAELRKVTGGGQFTKIDKI